MNNQLYEHAIVKFNSGQGALLCNACNIIIAHGFDHQDTEHYCEAHQNPRARAHYQGLVDLEDLIDEALWGGGQIQLEEWKELIHGARVGPS